MRAAAGYFAPSLLDSRSKSSPLSVFKPVVPRPSTPVNPDALRSPILNRLSRRGAPPRLAPRRCGRRRRVLGSRRRSARAAAGAGGRVRGEAKMRSIFPIPIFREARATEAKQMQPQTRPEDTYHFSFRAAFAETLFSFCQQLCQLQQPAFISRRLYNTHSIGLAPLFCSRLCLPKPALVSSRRSGAPSSD